MPCPEITFRELSPGVVIPPQMGDAETDAPAAGVDLWRMPLDSPQNALRERYGLLTRDEQERGAKFRFDRHRNRYIAARGAMRLVLSAYLGVAASEIRFEYGAAGKPALTPEMPSAGLAFNLSHSEEVAILGVTRAGDVGVDVQHARREMRSDAIARRFFAPAEYAALQTLPEAVRADAFFALWTRKEAFVKALGDGLGRALDSFEMNVDPSVDAQLLKTHVDGESVDTWCMYTAIRAPGLHASVAVNTAV